MQNSVFFLLLLIIVFEFTQASSATRFQNQTSSCTLPPPPRNGKISIFERINNTTPTPYVPGTQVSSGTTITIFCDQRYFLNNQSILICNNGLWSSPIGECQLICPPYFETKTTKVTCQNNGKPIDCQYPTDGTVATFKCAPYYEDPAILANPFRVCRGGIWDWVKPDCTPKCGRKPKTKMISEGYYPWNVAIFASNKMYKKPLVCTGSLINERIVVTVANCLYTDNACKIRRKKKTIILAAGKRDAFFIPLTSEENSNIQYSGVEEMYVPDTFLGAQRKFAANLGLIIAETPFEMTERVQPICIDWTGKFSHDFEWPQIDKALMPAPLTRDTYLNTEKSAEIIVPLVNHTMCYKQLSEKIKNKTTNYDSYYTYDKICSGYINITQEFAYNGCIINHGTGLISKKNELYYLIGVSGFVRCVHNDNKYDKMYIMFTQISLFVKSFILEKNNLYKPIPRSEFQYLCGIKSVTATTLLIGGEYATRGDYPWQIALYQIKLYKKEFICSGSIINSKIILTAAHCVTDAKGNLLEKNLFIVAAGKYFRDFHDPRDELAQFTTIKHIFIPPQYAGHTQNFLGDIAVLVTENAFKLSREVQPICIDWEAKYEKQFVYETAMGFVSGWGFIEQNGNLSDTLRDLQVPYINNVTCKEKIPEDYEVYLTFDKLCAGFQEQGKSVCGGDSGGGLVFKNKNDNRYYLAGVVSLTPRDPDGRCDSQQFSLYTRVSTYMSDFIYNIVKSNAG